MPRLLGLFLLPFLLVQEPSPVRLMIDAVAVDRQNAPVMDLTPGEIEVWIAGYRVPIASLRAVTTGNDVAHRAVVLILDDVTVPPTLVGRVKEVARRFVERLAPGDTMAITTFDGRSMEMTADRERLMEAIDAYNVRATGVRTIEGLGQQVLGLAAGISRHLTVEESRRSAIVAIGSAALFDRPIPPPTIARDLRREWTEAMRSLAFANANFYVIDPVGLSIGQRVAPSEGFSRETGGTAFVNTNDFAAAADRIMRESANYYLIEVVDPPAQRTADLRELELRVKRNGVTIRARRGIPGIGSPRRRP